MAEVRKRVVEDKYNTSKIKKSETKKETKKKTNKIVKKNAKKEKKNLFVRFRIFCHGVKLEFKKVHWPLKKDMVKYSVATIFFIIFCALFFYLIEVIFAFVQSLF